MHRTLAIVILQVSLVLNYALASPQSEHSAHLNLPVTVDGSKNPEKIPDKIANRHFILAAAEHRTLSPEESDRRLAVLSGLGFSEVDENAFVLALWGVREQLDTLDWSETQTRLDFSSRQALFNQILDSAFDRVEQAMSVEGLIKITGYVNTQVKPRMVIYSSVPK